MLTVLKILSWPVAAITEDFIVLFCVYSPLHAYEVGNCQVTPRLLCGVGRERQKRVCFPKAPWKSRDREGPPIQDHHSGALPAPRARRAQRGELLLECRLLFGSCFWKSLRLAVFIIPLIMKPLHCSHNFELQLIDFHFVSSVKSYLINAEMCREQLISSRQFLFK